MLELNIQASLELLKYMLVPLFATDHSFLPVVSHDCHCHPVAFRGFNTEYVINTGVISNACMSARKF